MECYLLALRSPLFAALGKFLLGVLIAMTWPAIEAFSKCLASVESFCPAVTWRFLSQMRSKALPSLEATFRLHRVSSGTPESRL